MRYKPTSLKGEPEIFRGLGAPFIECFIFWKTVEGYVKFHGGKPLAIVTEPLALGEAFGVEGAAPVVVGKATCADMDLWHS